MTLVADSGPLIHLAIVGQFHLLKRYFHELVIIPQVYDEIVTHGKGRPGDTELRQAVRVQWVVVQPVTNPFLSLYLPRLDTQHCAATSLRSK